MRVCANIVQVNDILVHQAMKFCASKGCTLKIVNPNIVISQHPCFLDFVDNNSLLAIGDIDKTNVHVLMHAIGQTSFL